MYKTVGIIGGMGPEATLYLFKKIIHLTEASCDQEHIPLIIDNNTKIPDRTAFLLGKGESPLEEIYKSALRLQSMGAKVMAMACNTAHWFYEEVKKSLDIPFISIIDVTADHLYKKYGNGARIGLLATKGVYLSQLYREACCKYSLEIIEPEDNQAEVLMQIIYSIKKGYKVGLKDLLLDILYEYKRKEIAGIILGCTELPLLFNDLATDEDIIKLNQEYIDTTELLAKAIVTRAKI